MATTLTSFSLSKSTFHGAQISTRAAQPIRSARPHNLPVSREMMRRYMTYVITYADTNNINVTIIEQSVSPEGGAWLGGQLFSAMVVRKPAHWFLDKLDIEYDEKDDYVV